MVTRYVAALGSLAVLVCAMATEAKNSMALIVREETPKSGNLNHDSPFRSFSYPLLPSREHPIELTIEQSHEQGVGSGGVVWAASEVLMEYCIQKEIENAGFWAGKRVLEVGSGTGVLGLLIHLLGAAAVTLTDQRAVLPLLHRNALANGRANVDDNQETVSVRELQWGKHNAQEYIGPHPVDFIVGSDVSYHDTCAELVQTLWEVSNPDTTILLTHTDRYEQRTRAFLRVAQKRFRVERVDVPTALGHRKHPAQVLLFSLQKRDQ